MLVVHHAPRTRSWRVLWLCEELGLPYVTRAWPYPPTPEYLRLNPLGTAPTVEDDGEVLTDSVAALIHLAQKHGAVGLLPPAGHRDSAAVLNWTIVGETMIGMQCNVLAAARFLAPEGEGVNWSVDFSRRRVLGGFAAVAGVLGDKAFLIGDDLTLADISVGYVVGMARNLGLEGDLPATILAYHDRMLARPAMQLVIAAA